VKVCKGKKLMRAPKGVCFGELEVSWDCPFCGRPVREMLYENFNGCKCGAESRLMVVKRRR